MLCSSEIKKKSTSNKKSRMLRYKKIFKNILCCFIPNSTVYIFNRRFNYVLEFGILGFAFLGCFI